MAHIHALAAVLVGGHVGDDLGHDVAGHLEALGAFDHLAVDHGAVVQHIADVDEAAVENGLHKVVGIVEVQDALIVSLADLLRQQDAAGQVAAHLAGNIVALGGGDDGVLVGVLFGQLLVGVAQQGENGFVGGVLLAHQSPGIAVDDIGLGQRILVQLHELMLHHILNVLHQQAGAVLLLHRVGNGADLIFRDAFLGVHGCIGLLDRPDDFAAVKVDRVAIPFDNFHH